MRLHGCLQQGLMLVVSEMQPRLPWHLQRAIPIWTESHKRDELLFGELQTGHLVDVCHLPRD